MAYLGSRIQVMFRWKYCRDRIDKYATYPIYQSNRYCLSGLSALVELSYVLVFYLISSSGSGAYDERIKDVLSGWLALA